DSLFRLRTRPFREEGVPGFNSEVYVGTLGPDPEWTVAGTLAGVELAPQLAAVPVPTMVLAGRYDRITPPVVQRGIARAIRGARLVVFERSGHRPEFEEPVRWNEVMDRFLASVLEASQPARKAAGAR